MKKIALHSAPRSGSTWIGSILDSSPNVAYRFQPLFSYSHKNQLNENSSKQEIEFFFQDILATKDDFVLQQEYISRGRVPLFVKKEITHIAYKEVRYHHILENLLKKGEDIKIIGLIRNPLSVINSWLGASKEFKKELGWKESEEWRFAPKKNLGKVEEFHGYEKWKEVALLFHKLKDEFPDRFYLLRYDFILKDTFTEVEKLFDFLDLQISEQTINFIEKSLNTENNDAYSVFRKNQTDNKWENNLPEYITDFIKRDIENTELQNYIK